MSDTGESAVTPQLREDLESWLADRVEGTDRTADEELERIVAIYRLATDATEPGTDVENLPEAESLARLPDRLEETREEFQQGIEDVRERVIQVLEETHDRAEKRHTHPEIDDSIAEITDRTESLEKSLAELEESLAELEKSLAELERSLDAEDRRPNVESLQTDLEGTTDRLDGFATRLDTVDGRSEETERKLDTLASAVVRLRKRADRLEARVEFEDRLDALREEANRTGSRTADCGQCGRSVTVALLSAPSCPHCEATFQGIDPSRGFFGSSTLVADDRPALEGETVRESDVGDDGPDEQRRSTGRE